MNRAIIVFILFGLFAQLGFSQCNENTVWDQVWYSCEQRPSPGSTDDLTHWILYDLGQAYALGATQIGACGVFRRQPDLVNSGRI